MTSVFSLVLAGVVLFLVAQIAVHKPLLAYPEDQRLLLYSLNGGKYYRVYDTVTVSAIVECLGSMPSSSPIDTF